MALCARLGAVLALLIALQGVQGGTSCSDYLCRKCNEKRGQCSQCISGYYKDEEGFCTRCKDPLCGVCTADECTTCMEYDPDSQDGNLIFKNRKGVCRVSNVSFRDNCQGLDGAGKCSRCRDGFFLNGTARTCEPCREELCARCSPPRGRCQQCKAVFFEEDDSDFPSYPVYKNASGKCAPCTKQSYASGCRACDVDGRCTRCEESFRLNPATGRCQSCSNELCAECGADLKTCRRCVEIPYWAESDLDFGPIYKNSEGECTECTKHLRGYGCRECNSQGQCTRCAAGASFLRNGACAPCSALTPRCIKCTKTGRCNKCEEGYGVLDGRCVPCQDKLCQACSSPDRCVACKFHVDDAKPNSPTVFLDRRGRCRQNAKDCVESRGEGATCRTCRAGFRVVDGSCVRCKHYHDCVPCTESVNGCSKCDASGKWCRRCSFMSGHDRLCRRCMDPLCECAQDYRKCSDCRYIEGKRVFLDRSANTCRECGEGCSQCDTAGCRYCDTGYILVGKECKRCADPLCSECDAATLKKCTLCSYQPEDGIWRYGKPAKDGQCKGCSVRGCEQCRPNGTCARCQYGYMLKGGKCVI